MAQLSPYLENVQDFYNNHRPLCRGIVAAFAGITVLRWVKRRRDNARRNAIRKAYPGNTVILHHIGRGPYAPSMIPFAVKLETYLRMAKIPYQTENSFERSSKQKYPWITYNGEDIADSDFCIQHLNKIRNVNLNSWLTTEQCAIAVAFQRLVEDNLYWVLFVTCWVNEINADFLQKAPLFDLPMLMVKLTVIPALGKMAWAQGTGRHSPADVRQIARKDLTALSDFMGSKKFLMGNKPCEQDCALFGMLSHLYWQMPSTINTIFTEEFPQLVAYCERMKETFWPDWVDCTTRGGTTPATK
ncbi:hypothetical protein ACOMHN_057871 [Nucella lapillus]